MRKLSFLLFLVPFILMIGSMASCKNPADPTILTDETPTEAGTVTSNGGEGNNCGANGNEVEENNSGQVANGGETGNNDEGGEDNGNVEGAGAWEDDEGDGEEPHIHIAVDWVITLVPSCEEDGFKELRCADDGELLKTASIPAIGHDWNEVWETVSFPDKTQDGIEAVTCLNDSTHIRESRIFAYSTGTDGLAFSLTGDSYKISSASGNAIGGTVYIPAFWRPKGVTAFDSYKPVTVIGSYVFANKENITGILIPSGVTSIEQYAFYNCTGIEEIAIPATVTTIGKWAFSGWGTAGPQTIILPFATIEEAITAWGTDWQQGFGDNLSISYLS